MSEFSGYCKDLFPEGFGDVPPDTWSGINVERATDDLIRRSTFTEEEVRQREAAGRPIGLRELARNQRPYAGPSPETRERLKERAPHLLDVLEREAKRQQDNYEWEHGHPYEGR